MMAERAFIDRDGLSGRPWSKHMLYAPSKHNNYGSKTFPGVDDAIEKARSLNTTESWRFVQHEVWRVSRAVTHVSLVLDGAIPVLSQVMIATRGATDAFSGVHRHVNNSLRKVGAKNIEAGIGCGVGFGHGFGVGLAVKPGVLHQIQSNFLQMSARLMIKLGIGSDSTLSIINQASLPASLQTGTSMVKEPSRERISQLVKTLSNSTSNGIIRDGKTIVSSEGTLAPKSAGVNTQYSSRTEEVLNNFLKNPLLKEGRSSLHEQAGALQLENNVLQMVLKHQVLIEELMQENEKLRQILVEELKVQPSKFQSNFTSRSKSSCTDCFECRRKQRKR